MSKAESQLIIFTTEDEKVSVDVRFDVENVWLTQQQIAQLFDTARSTIVEHIKHIYEEGELAAEATCRDFRQVRTEGTRQVTRMIPHYDLNMIISVGSTMQLQHVPYSLKRHEAGNAGAPTSASHGLQISPASARSSRFPGCCTRHGREDL